MLVYKSNKQWEKLLFQNYLYDFATTKWKVYEKEITKKLEFSNNNNKKTLEKNVQQNFKIHCSSKIDAHEFYTTHF